MNVFGFNIKREYYLCYADCHEPNKECWFYNESVDNKDDIEPQIFKFKIADHYVNTIKLFKKYHKDINATEIVN